MKFVLKLGDKQIFYDENHVFIDGIMCATYNDNGVTWLSTSSLLSKFNHYSDHSWILHDEGILEAHNRDKILRNQSYNKILGTYTGTHSGALASYIAYKHSLTTPFIKKTACPVSSTEPKQKASETPKKSPEKTKVTQPKKTTSTQQSVQKELPHKPEQKYIPPKQEPPKIEKRHEEPPIYEPPKQEYEYKKPDFTPPPAPIPSGGSEENSGCLGPIAWLAIGILVLIIAIKMIPQSWKDLSTYIPEGDIGITICFFSSLIGGIIAVLMSLFVKECKFTSCLSAFLITCGIGIGINILILFKDIVAGDYEFTGFILFDLPLAVFAPILGCFQFAFPIGIGVIIICGIICLIKKNS